MAFSKTTFVEGVTGLSATEMNNLGDQYSLASSDLTTRLPSGLITLWHGTIANIPTGWVICDGNNSTPNLLSKMVKGVATAATNPGTTGGADTHTLSLAESPVHDHNTTIGISGGGPGATAGVDAVAYNGTAYITPVSTSKGSGSAHNNLPAYYSIAYLMKT